MGLVAAAAAVLAAAVTGVTAAVLPVPFKSC